MTAPDSTVANPAAPAVSEQQSLYDVAGISAYFKSKGADGATENFARGLITSGQVAHVRIGRKYYVSRASLDRWLAMQEKKSR